MAVETPATHKGKASVTEGDTPLPTEAELSGQRTKNIKMKQYLCVKHALPKTRLTHTILHENVSQDRHLEMTMSQINHTKSKSSNVYDLSRRAFLAQQERKMKKWKREDDNRIAGMNLPSIHHQDILNPPVTVVIYHMPDEASDTGRKDQTLPMMRVRRERTEIVCHQDKTFVTKFPSVVEVDQTRLARHNTYCGKSLLMGGAPRQDNRFTELETQLRPAILKDTDTCTAHNMVAKSRRAKYANIFPMNSDPGYRRSADARILVASGPRSLSSSKYSDRSFGKGGRKFSCSILRKKSGNKGRLVKSGRKKVAIQINTPDDEDYDDVSDVTEEVMQ